MARERNRRLGWLAAPAVLALTVSAAAAPWPQAQFNPQPLDGDVVLPMPCGGSMVFRRIDTQAENNWLADRRVRLGGTDSRFSASEDRRHDYLVGGFSEGGHPAKRFFYMGKYEVSRAQYAAVMSPQNCAAPKDEDALPKDQIGWFDAVAFTRQYTEWLMTSARKDVPQEDKRPGHIRLPTEVEWEYAARGGSLIMPDKEAEPLFDKGRPVTDYAWVADPQSCDGKLRPVGRRSPNPAGLFDVLGNVAEITLEPYRATAHDRLHGQPGGFVVRGGSCLTATADVRLADRHEEPLYQRDTGLPRQAAFVGMRVVIGAPVGTSQTRINAFKAAASDEEAPANPAPVAQASVPAVPVEPASSPNLPSAARLIAAEAAKIDPAVMTERLNQLASDIAAQRAREMEITAAGARMAVMSGAILLRDYRHEMNETERLEALLPGVSEQFREQYRQNIDGWKNRARLSGSAYLSLLVEAADNYGADLMRSQLPRIADALRYEGSAAIVAMTRRFVDQCARYRGNPPRSPSDFLDEGRRPL